MSLYSKSMKNASQILFWMAILAGFGTCASVLANVWGMVSSGMADVYQPHGARAFLQILMAVLAGVSAATWPFLAAAVLWVLEKRLPIQEAAE